MTYCNFCGGLISLEEGETATCGKLCKCNVQMKDVPITPSDSLEQPNAFPHVESNATNSTTPPPQPSNPVGRELEEMKVSAVNYRNVIELQASRLADLGDQLATAQAENKRLRAACSGVLYRLETENMIWGEIDDLRSALVETKENDHE